MPCRKVEWKRVTAALADVRVRALLGVLGAAVLVSAVVFFRPVFRRPPAESQDEAVREIAHLDAKAMRKQISLAESRIRRLTEKRERLLQASPAILVDSAENKIYLYQGSKVVMEGKCSTGSGLKLTDTSGSRSWTFETPRGYFLVLGKFNNPVWLRPDWAFIEEGESIPKDRASRAVADVLGDHALAFGDGYFIHGTLYSRTLGSRVTHGCIRVDDETLEKLYQIAERGTPIWIY